MELEDQLRILVGVGLTGLLVLLRLDAYRFGAAEYDDESELRRLARRWPAAGVVRDGIALALAIWYVFPTPVTTLHLDIGTDRAETLILGLVFGGLGTLVAVPLRLAALSAPALAGVPPLPGRGGQRHRARPSSTRPASAARSWASRWRSAGRPIWPSPSRRSCTASPRASGRRDAAAACSSSPSAPASWPAS